MLKDLQRTAEWLEKRKGRITGSRAGAVLGLCPWRKPDDVLREMVREYHGYPSEFERNPAIDWGVNHEKQALLYFQRNTGLTVEECGFFPVDDWMGASPDGLTSDGRVLEVKVPYGLRNGGEFKPLSDQPHYMVQVQIEMIATGRKAAYFAQYSAPVGDVFDPDHIGERMLIEDVYPEPIDLDGLHAFYQRYLSELDNPEHLEPKRVVIDSDEALSIINRMDEINESLTRLEDEKKSHMAKLIEMAGDKSALVCGRKLTRTERKGAVDYSKIIPEGVDVGQYRKKSSVVWRLS